MKSIFQGARFPSARGSSGHQLFISAFIISSKVMCDDTYSNKSWSVVAHGMFNLQEINQMEREICNYLEWELTLASANPMLSAFEMAVKRDFCKQSQLIQIIRLHLCPSTQLEQKLRHQTVHSKNSHLHPAQYQDSLKMALPVPNREHQPKVLGTQILTYLTRLLPLSLILPCPKLRNQLGPGQGWLCGLPAGWFTR